MSFVQMIFYLQKSLRDPLYSKTMDEGKDTERVTFSKSGKHELANLIDLAISSANRHFQISGKFILE